MAPVVWCFCAAFGALGWRPGTSNIRPNPPRSGHLATSDSNGRVHLFGGYAEIGAGGAVKRDPVSDSWTWTEEGGWMRRDEGTAEGGARPQPRLASAGGILGDELLVFGGWDPRPAGTGGVIVADVWAQCLETGKWSRLEADMPRGPTSRHVACVVGNTLVVHTFRCADAVLVWDATKRRLMEQPTSGTSPSSRGLHTAAALDGSRMVVFGGADKSGAMCADAFVLDTSTWHWTRLDPGTGPTARAGSCAAQVAEGQILIFGGAERAPSGQGLVARGDAWLLDVKPGAHASKWNLVVGDDAAEEGGVQRDAPLPRNAASLTRVRSGGADLADAKDMLVLHGGWNPFVQTYDDTWVMHI
mmetsp:Transcript_28788/g.84366  ORF Transcript_28788/g.84366 Transcript_28788/m.84366 type:complete len:358 (+) Transcript_28788:21-1094(+)